MKSIQERAREVTQQIRAQERDNMDDDYQREGAVEAVLRAQLDDLRERVEGLVTGHPTGMLSSDYAWAVRDVLALIATLRG